MAQSRAMHWKQLRNRKLYDMSAQLSTKYQGNEKQNISVSTKSKEITQKYFSATQLVISCRAAPCYAGILKVAQGMPSCWFMKPEMPF